MKYRSYVWLLSDLKSQLNFEINPNKDSKHWSLNDSLLLIDEILTQQETDVLNYTDTKYN